MSGLPFEFEQGKLETILKDKKTLNSSVLLGQRKDGSLTGFATVLCEDEESARDAARTMHRSKIGNRWISARVVTYGQYSKFHEIQESHQNQIRQRRYQNREDDRWSRQIPNELRARASLHGDIPSDIDRKEAVS